MPKKRRTVEHCQGVRSLFLMCKREPQLRNRTSLGLYRLEFDVWLGANGRSVSVRSAAVQNHAFTLTESLPSFQCPQFRPSRRRQSTRSPFCPREPSRLPLRLLLQLPSANHARRRRTFHPCDTSRRRRKPSLFSSAAGTLVPVGGLLPVLCRPGEPLQPSLQ